MSSYHLYLCLTSTLEGRTYKLRFYMVIICNRIFYGIIFTAYFSVLVSVSFSLHISMNYIENVMELLAHVLTVDTRR